MTLDQWAAEHPAVDGRIPLSLGPVSPHDPAGERWLVPELTDFGTTIYSYCEENSDCIVDELAGSVGVVELRVLMAAETKRLAEEAAKINIKTPLDNRGLSSYSEQVDDEEL